MMNLLLFVDNAKYHRLELRPEIPETSSFPLLKGASGPKAACAGRFDLAGVVEGAGMESAMEMELKSPPAHGLEFLGILRVFSSVGHPNV